MHMAVEGLHPAVWCHSQGAWQGLGAGCGPAWPQRSVTICISRPGLKALRESYQDLFWEGAPAGTRNNPQVANQRGDASPVGATTHNCTNIQHWPVRMCEWSSRALTDALQTAGATNHCSAQATTWLTHKTYTGTEDKKNRIARLCVPSALLMHSWCQAYPARTPLRRRSFPSGNVGDGRAAIHSSFVEGFGQA